MICFAWLPAFLGVDQTDKTSSPVRQRITPQACPDLIVTVQPLSSANCNCFSTSFFGCLGLLAIAYPPVSAIVNGALSQLRHSNETLTNAQSLPTGSLPVL